MALITQGQRFGRWTVLEDQQYTFVRKVAVKCDCGSKVAKVNVGNLNSGRSQSCGCINREILAKAGHGKLKHPVNPGDVFGRLTVVDSTNRDKVECICTCGNTSFPRASALYRGNTRSCGCIKREVSSALGKASASRGGLSGHTLFNTWERLNNSPAPLHEPWSADVNLFITQVEAAIGPRPEGMRLTMINPELGYMPGNLEWGAGRMHPNQRVVLTQTQRQEIAEAIHAGERQYVVAKRYGVSASLASTIYRDYRYSKQ